MHAVHGDIHEIGLQDNCGACEDHARNPWSSLDHTMLAALIKRNYLFRFGNVPGDKAKNAPRSDNESLAMAQITNVMERVGKLMEHDPLKCIQAYLETRWHIDFQ